MKIKDLPFIAFLAILFVLGIALIIAIFVCYSVFSWAIVLNNFWYWFLIPVFPNLPLITLKQSIGIMFVINLFKTKFSNNEDEEDALNSKEKEKIKKKKKNNLLIFFLSPWITLLIGYIFYLFIA